MEREEGGSRDKVRRLRNSHDDHDLDDNHDGHDGFLIENHEKFHYFKGFTSSTAFSSWLE